MAKNPSSRGRSSIPPLHPVKPPQGLAASTDAAVLRVEVPHHLEDRWGGPRHTDIEKTSAPASAPEFSQLISPVFSLSGTRVPVGLPACGLTLPPLIARPPSSFFLSGGLRAHPGPRSRTPRSMKACRGSGCRRGGGKVTVVGSGGPRAPVNYAKPFVRGFPAEPTQGPSPPGRVASSVATVLLAASANSSPREMTLDDVAAR